MNTADKVTIENFAAGDNSLRARAIEVHRHHLRFEKSYFGTDHQRFMSEVDCDIPDLVLRARYRKAIAPVHRSTGKE